MFKETHLRVKEYHLPYGITQCYLPLETGEHTEPQQKQTTPKRRKTESNSIVGYIMK